ncbi:hypothetical protein BJY52DRAFT_1311973 [Lactarius psammicola]|nr:hypothetical protein BJY52DRAFT_1311973 [Lactarius psammicola]
MDEIKIVFFRIFLKMASWGCLLLHLHFLWDLWPLTYSRFDAICSLFEANLNSWPTAWARASAPACWSSFLRHSDVCAQMLLISASTHGPSKALPIQSAIFASP